MNYNKIVIIGRVTQQPTTKVVGNTTVSNINVVTNRFWTDNNGAKQEKSEYHTVVAWGKLAETCGKYLQKGQIVMFEGRLETRSWQDKEGKTRKQTEIIANEMQMGEKDRNQPMFTSKYSSPQAIKEEEAKDNNIIKMFDINDDIDIRDIPF